MPTDIKQFERTWLLELERRLMDGLTVDPREMMVTLRDQLPRGFQPGWLRQGLLYHNGPSVEGLKAIGDSGKILPEVDRAINWIRDRLIEYPSLAGVTATELAEALSVSPARAERVLALMSSLGTFFSGATGGPNGFTSIALSRDDILAEYLGFRGIDDALSRREKDYQSLATGTTVTPVPVTFSVEPPEAPVTRNTAFILMSMDPQDDSLTDVRDTIKAACGAFGIRAIRVDDIEHQDRITDKILESIATSEFVIADLTGERPNVYYEIGYAHALDKRPILVRRKGTRLHFDLSVHNVPEYRNNHELKDILLRRLEAILGRQPKLS